MSALEGADHRMQRMERMYRLQRFIYDPTRRFYLPGRDRAIAELEAGPGTAVLEIGCGTGRNLMHIARRYPGARVFGVDASAAMLRTARARRARAGVAHRIRLARGDAVADDPAAMFDVAGGFDRVLFSYALSMIGLWRAALARAVAALAPGGRLHVVDFGAMTGLPGAVRGGLRAWLALFGVRPCPEVVAALEARAGTVVATDILGGYAFHARLGLDGRRAPRLRPMDASAPPAPVPDRRRDQRRWARVAGEEGVRP